MKVLAMSVDPFTGLPVVLLRDEQCGCTVSITIGLSEASAIATELEHIEFERPATHHLIGNILSAAGVKLESVEVYDFCECAFQARIHLKLPNGERAVQEGRPSDVLALALHCGADILVSSRVIEKVGDYSAVPLNASSRKRVRSPSCSDEYDLSCVVDEAFGKWKM